MYTGYIRKQEGTSMFNVHVYSFVLFGEKKRGHHFSCVLTSEC